METPYERLVRRYKKRLHESTRSNEPILRWSPLVILGNIALLAGAFAISFGVYFFMTWLRDEIGSYPSAGFAFGVVGAFFVICRLVTGRWPW